MLRLLWLIPAIPMASAVVLALFGAGLRRRVVSIIGVGSVFASAVIASAVAADFVSSPPEGNAYRQVLWNWIGVGSLRLDAGLYLDALSLLMTLVVTCVGALIHLYSTEYMAHGEGFSRFFAYMNLFVASMLILVLGDNLVFLFLGWEGVGLCSFLLIGFWFTDPANVKAALKAFIVTRVGDTAFMIGLFLLFQRLGSLDIQQVLQNAQAQWPTGSAYAIAAAALLLGGAVGKSAQLPLHTWLPDAMAGPTPTSALIHAATMVTAGVYLIARTHALFVLAPPVMTAVAVIGALGLLMAGFSALTQREIKKVLAWSTVSQIGYMFLALGVGAWIGAMFHFFTHAFFKALLFLAAGHVVETLHENDIFRMGGLRKDLPITYWSFVIGGSALAGLPYITAGSYSKDQIIWRAWASPYGHPLLWAAAVAAVLLTSLYTYRLIFLVFFGSEAKTPEHLPGMAMLLPVIVLCVPSIAAGWLNRPPALGAHRLFDNFLESALPPAPAGAHPVLSEGLSELAAASAFAIGLALAWWLYIRRRAHVEAFASSGPAAALHRLWFSGWGFDSLYDALFVRPVVWIATVNKSDVVDQVYAAVSLGSRALNRALAVTQTGRVRWYAAGIAGGAAVLLGIAIFL
ncbi:MAG: NADH-quinone oxidoreductase subunit L [Acidobacteria bacterium]|nr:NADH-quinone oxidoreductase subunit L [Acidobacteriota bacterium]